MHHVCLGAPIMKKLLKSGNGGASAHPVLAIAVSAGIGLSLVAACVAASAAATDAEGASGEVTIWASRVIDGVGHVMPDTRVTIRGNKIVGIDHERNATYELSGMTLMPGLIDVHDHIYWHFNREERLHHPGDGEDPVQAELSAAGEAWKTLRGGFTTVQSPGSPEDRDLRDWINMGRIPGPRILTSLRPLANDKLSPEQLRALVDERHAQGADFIKIFGSRSIRDNGAQTMSQEQMNAMCGEANKLGMRTLVHAHADSAVRAAINAGCTEVEHGFFATPETFKLMAEKHVTLDPQCGLISQNYLDNWAKYEGIGNYNAAGKAAMKKSLVDEPRHYKEALSIKGLNIVFGTDAVAGAHGHEAQQMVCMVDEAGMKPMDVITMATSTNAKSIGLGAVIGQVASGFQADLIAVPGDPLNDINRMTQVEFVMKGGEVFRNTRGK